MPKGQFKVVFTFTVNDIEKMKEKAPAVVDANRAEAGCVSQDVCIESENGSNFAFVTTWESEDAFKAFKESPRFQEMKGKVKDNYKGEWHIKTYKVVY